MGLKLSVFRDDVEVKEMKRKFKEQDKMRKVEEKEMRLRRKEEIQRVRKETKWATKEASEYLKGIKRNNNGTVFDMVHWEKLEERHRIETHKRERAEESMLADRLITKDDLHDKRDLDTYNRGRENEKDYERAIYAAMMEKEKQKKLKIKMECARLKYELPS